MANKNTLRKRAALAKEIGRRRMDARVAAKAAKDRAKAAVEQDSDPAGM